MKPVTHFVQDIQKFSQLGLQGGMARKDGMAVKEGKAGGGTFQGSLWSKTPDKHQILSRWRERSVTRSKEEYEVKFSPAVK